MEKTKYEKKDTKNTRATFSLSEFLSFSHANFLRDRYLSKVHQRAPNPRLNDLGEEVLSDVSMVADVDMNPLSTKAKLGRFSRMPSEPINGDGYDADLELDAEGRPIDSDEEFFVDDRSDNPPSPHEVRVKRLEKRRDAALKAQQEAIDKKREEGDRKLLNPPPEPPKEPEGSKKG